MVVVRGRRGGLATGNWATMVRRLLPLGAALLLVGVLASPARAIGSFGPPVSIDDPPCAFDGFNADLARDADEVAHGFADLWGSNCNTGVRIDYFQGSGTTWTREATPYHGFVVAVAWDPTGTYLLYVDIARLELRITKLRIKPGKPFVFGVKENSFAFGLPGNPVSAYVCTMRLASRLLDRTPWRYLGRAVLTVGFFAACWWLFVVVGSSWLALIIAWTCARVPLRDSIR